MKIAVLGGTGFVGSALAEKLLKKGHEVQILARPSFDLQQPESFEQIDIDTEAVVHAAGIVGAGHSPTETWLTNVKGMYDLCGYLKNLSSLRYFLCLSSGAVYGYSEEGCESDSSVSPLGDYGMSKYLAEVIGATSLSCSYGIARLFFPYGPGQSLNRLIPQLIKRVSSGEAIDLKGANGEPILSPVFIDDLVVALSVMIESQFEDINNIGGEPICLRSICELIGKLTGKTTRFQIDECLPASLYCSIGEGFSVETELEEGLKKTVKWIGAC